MRKMKEITGNPQVDNSYKLPAELHGAIFKRLEKEMLEESIASDSPRIAILGGQPGAGQSKLTEFAREHLFRDKKPAMINGDDYRTEHPLYLNNQRKAVEEKMIARGASGKEISAAKAIMAGAKRTRESLSR